MSSLIYNTVETVILQLAALEIDHLRDDQQERLMRVFSAELGTSPRGSLDLIRAFIARPMPKNPSLKRVATSAMQSRALYNATKMYRTTVR